MIGLKEIVRRKLQFALIALVVTLISYLVLMINGLGIGLNKQAGSAILQLDADAIAYSSSSGLSVIRSELPSQTIADVASVPGVVASSPLAYLSVNTKTPDGDVTTVALLGYVPGGLGQPQVTGGRLLSQPDTQGVLVDAKFLRTSNLAIGDTMTVVNRLQTHDLEIVGEVKEGYFFFQPVAYVLLDSLREIKYGTAAAGTPEASLVLAKGKDLVGRKADGFEMVSKRTAFANIEGVQGQQQTIDALRFFGFLIGALVVGIFFYVLTLQKIQQVGTLKAIGASNRFLFGQMLVQVITVILVGVLLSTAGAYGTYILLSSLPKAIPISFTVQTFAVTSALFFGTGLIGLAFSLRRVSRVDPIIAIGQQQ